MYLLVASLLLTTVGQLSVAARVDGERAVERARYQFVLGATKPFDELYPRSVFERRVRREIEQEHVLEKVFGLTMTPRLLEDEYDRIQQTTQAPEQWAAVQKALGGDRRLIEEVFCRPLVVDRTLRAKFAFDQKIHAVEHQEAREARALFLAAKIPLRTKILSLSRLPQNTPSAEILLNEAKAQSAVPRTIQPVSPGGFDAPVHLDPELAAVLEKQFGKPGDVTTILEERDRFEVFRLLEVDPAFWRVEAFLEPKKNFDAWFERIIRRRPRARPAS